MFEDESYEAIIARMQARVAEKYPEFDYREGSMIFNAHAPAALELAILYDAVDNVYKEQFVQTASRSSLLMLCEQMGINIGQFSATYCTVKAQFDAPIDIGTRWNCDVYNYIVTEEIGIENGLWMYYMDCETAGSGPNMTVGEITPINYVNNNLKNAVIVEVTTTAQDEWSDDEIRSTYIDYVNDSAIDGNVAQYKAWAKAYPGIGKYKVFPLWNGANTVKVSILDEDFQPCTVDFVADFQEYMDPGVTGMGDGVAPIGAFVTISTPTTIAIDVTADVVISDDAEAAAVQSMMSETLEVYFREISFDKSVVSYMSVGAILSDVDGVDFINNLRLNNGTSNITLASEQVPVVGTATWNVVTE